MLNVLYFKHLNYRIHCNHGSAYFICTYGEFGFSELQSIITLCNFNVLRHLTNYLLMSVGSPVPWHFNRCLGHHQYFDLWLDWNLGPHGWTEVNLSSAVSALNSSKQTGRVVFIFWVWFSVSQCFCFVVRMCLVRLKTEGKDGKFMFKKLVQMMWFDVEERIKNLGVGTMCSD